MCSYYYYIRYFILSFIITYFVLIGSLCQDQKTVEPIGIQDSRLPDSVERIVEIDKELIPWKDSYSLGESPRVFVEVKFIKYKNMNWKLKNLHINEMFDENIKIQNGSFGLVIGNIADVSKYKTAQKDPGQVDIYSFNKIDTNKFEIVIDKEFDSSKRVFYWYNVNLEKAGIFSTNTAVISNPKIGIYSDIDQSLRLQIENFNPIDSYWNYLKDIIYIISILIGLFTFYKQIVKQNREIHLKDFVREMKDEFCDLIQAIPRVLIIFLSSIIFYIYSYSYFRPYYPQIYLS